MLKKETRQPRSHLYITKQLQRKAHFILGYKKCGDILQMSRTGHHRKRNTKDNDYDDVESGLLSMLKSSSSEELTSDDGSGDNKGHVDVHHHHHHHVTTTPEKIGIGIDTGNASEPYTEFTITNAVQMVIGWFMLLFSYIILGLFIWMIVILST